MLSNKWKKVILILVSIFVVVLLFRNIFPLSEEFTLADDTSLTKNAVAAFIANSSSCNSGKWIDKTTNANDLTTGNAQYNEDPKLGGVVSTANGGSGFYTSNLKGLSNSKEMTIVFWMYFTDVRGTDNKNPVLITLNRSPTNYINELYLTTKGMFDYGVVGHRNIQHRHHNSVQNIHGYGFNTSFSQTPYSEAGGAYQLVFVKKRTTGYWYINGNLCGTAFETNNNKTITYGKNDVSIGYDMRDKTNVLENTSIKGIFMYNYAFSKNDVLFNNTKFIRTSHPQNMQVDTDGLVLNLECHNRDGNTWKNATLVNCSVDASGFGGNESRVNFDGSTSYITLPRLDGFSDAGIDDISILFWLYTDNVSDALNQLFSINRQNGTKDGSLECRLNGVSDYAAITGNRTVDYTNTKNTSVKYAGYYHVAFVRSMKNSNQEPSYSSFVNGALVKNVPITNAANYRNMNICIGGLGAPSSDNFKGAIHSVYVYNRALTPIGIMQNYDMFLNRIKMWSPDYNGK